jgi:tetratricopeptide (TPR) repeat protein
LEDGLPASGCPPGDVLAAFVGGDLSADEVGTLQEHLTGCSSCVAVVGAAAVAVEHERRDEPGPIAAGSRIDRYHVLGVAGAGAIGIVYAAYDPRLDRKIAVKVLRRSRAPLDDHLLREARAMARVQSPHVVAVHDVATFADGVFVAMDFVEGRTLREWLAERRRTPAEVLDAFGQAGRGLAAAHAAGVVHRDFKPDNVLVRTDSRIAVTDFGLARLSSGGEAEVAGAGDPAPLEQTRTGAIAGTPAYMAPEVRSGIGGDARSDLFSFCVALYAALFGRHPFPTTSARALAEAAARGQVHPPREGSVPGHVRDAVLAGLRPRPEDRPASMEALLARLERDPRRRLRQGVALALPLAALAVASALAFRPRPEVCGGAEKALAGIWGDRQRAALEQGFAASASPIAAQAAAVVERALDGYGASWRAAYRDTCEATRVRGEQSEAMLDQRMACLDERRLAFAELVDALAAVSRDGVEHAALAAQELAPVGSCANPRRLSAAAEPPGSSAFLPLVTLARASAARAVEQEYLGEHDLAVRTLAPALAVAQASGYHPLEAEARLAEGRVYFTTDYRKSEDGLHRAAIAAERIGRLDLEAEARLMLAHNLGFSQLRTVEALRVADYAEAVVERLGDPLLTGDLMVTRGAIYSGSDEPARAVPLEEAALRVLESHLGPESVKVARVQFYLGTAYFRQGRYAEAAAVSERCARVRAATLGPDNPDTLIARFRLGSSLLESGRISEALAIHEQVLAAQERVLVPDHPDIALSLNNLSLLYLDLGRLRDSIATARRAVAIDEHRLGPDDPALTLPLDALADSLALDEQPAEAVAVVKRSVALAERLPSAHPKLRDALMHEGRVLAQTGRCVEAMPILEHVVALFDHDAPGNPLISFALDDLGRCWRDRGEPRRAAPLYERSLAVREQAVGARSPLLGDSLVGLADAERERGDDVAAERAARRACAIVDRSGLPPSIADAHFALARALVARDPPGARREAEAAFAALKEVPEHPTHRLIATWLADPRNR